MKLSVDFGRWTTMKAVLAVAGALAIGGAVGSAVAISPTMDGPVKWQGGWEFASIGVASAGQELLYLVPAGRNLMVTDLTVTNFGSSISQFSLFSGSSGGCNITSKMRLRTVAVPAGDVTHVSYETGIGFSAGTPVCINKNTELYVNARGYLFTAAPAS